MTNFEALKTLPMKTFANMIFDSVKTEYNTLADFEEMLQREFPENLHGALYEIQQGKTLSQQNDKENGNHKCYFLDCGREGVIMDNVEIAPLQFEQHMVCNNHVGRKLEYIFAKGKCTPETTLNKT